jgi:hypothetical protein
MLYAYLKIERKVDTQRERIPLSEYMLKFYIRVKVSLIGFNHVITQKYDKAKLADDIGRLPEGIGRPVHGKPCRGRTFFAFRAC